MSENEFQSKIIAEIERVRSAMQEQVELARQPRWLAWIGGILVVLTLVTTVFGIYDRFVTNSRLLDLELRSELREIMDQIAQINLRRAEASNDIERLQIIQGGTNSVRFSLAQRAAEIMTNPDLTAPASEYLFVSENLMEFSDFEKAFEIGKLAYQNASGFVVVLSTRNQLAQLYYRSSDHRNLEQARTLYRESVDDIGASGEPSEVGNYTSTMKQWIAAEVLYGDCTFAQKLIDEYGGKLLDIPIAHQQWMVGMRLSVSEQNRAQSKCALKKP